MFGFFMFDELVGLIVLSLLCVLIYVFECWTSILLVVMNLLNHIGYFVAFLGFRFAFAHTNCTHIIVVFHCWWVVARIQVTIVVQFITYISCCGFVHRLQSIRLMVWLLLVVLKGIWFVIDYWFLYDVWWVVIPLCSCLSLVNRRGRLMVCFS
eukprot:gene2756-1741_t